MDLYKELIRKRIKEKFKTIEAFAQYLGIPRTTINFILKNGVGSSNYNMVMKILDTLDISHANNIPVVNDKQLADLIQKYTALDDLGKHTVCSVAETEYRRITPVKSAPTIAAYGGLTSDTPLTDEEKLILTLAQKIKDKTNNDWFTQKTFSKINT